MIILDDCLLTGSSLGSPSLHSATRDYRQVLNAPHWCLCLPGSVGMVHWPSAPAQTRSPLFTSESWPSLLPPKNSLHFSLNTSWFQSVCQCGTIICTTYYIHYISTSKHTAWQMEIAQCKPVIHSVNFMIFTGLALNDMYIAPKKCWLLDLSQGPQSLSIHIGRNFCLPHKV